MPIIRKLVQIPAARYSVISSSSITSTVTTEIKKAGSDKTITEPVKEKWKERVLKYWKNLYRDYTEVGKDVINDARDRPLRAIFLLWGSAFCYVSASLNPDEKHLINSLRTYTNDVILVSERLQNQQTVAHLKMMENSLNSGVLRRMNLGIISFLWLDDYDSDCKLYKCTCSYLRPSWRNFHDRIIDVGFWDKWWTLDSKMVDYDVNY